MRGIEIAVLTLMALMGAGLAPAFAQGPSEAATGRAVEWQTGDDVFAAAEELTFDRKVKGVLTAAGQIVILTRDAKIGGDTWIAARRVAVEGELEGDLSIRAQEALINGAVKGNVTFYGLDLSFGPDAEIAGNVTYYSPSAARIDKGAKVAGEINGEDFAVSRSIEQAEPRGSMRETWRQEHMNERWDDRSGLAAPGYRMTAPGAVFFGALAVAFSFLAPAATARMRDGLAGEWAIAFGLGFLWLAGLPVLTSAACGYAHYIEEAAAGHVVPLPFEQDHLNRTLADMLADAAARRQWRASGLEWAERADIYSQSERAADIILKP